MLPNVAKPYSKYRSPVVLVIRRTFFVFRILFNGELGSLKETVLIYRAQEALTHGAHLEVKNGTKMLSSKRIEGDRYFSGLDGVAGRNSAFGRGRNPHSV
jgi:hypothetical protein